MEEQKKTRTLGDMTLEEFAETFKDSNATRLDIAATYLSMPELLKGEPLDDETLSTMRQCAIETYGKKETKNV